MKSLTMGSFALGIVTWFVCLGSTGLAQSIPSPKPFLSVRWDFVFEQARFVDLWDSAHHNGLYRKIRPGLVQRG